MARHFRPVIADPDIIRVGQRAIIIVRAAMKIGVISRLRQDLHQAARMSEGIKIDGRCRFDAELFHKISPAAQNLTDKGFATGHITVRLQVPPAHDVPLALLYQSLYTRKEGRFIFLDPFVQDSFVMIKDEAVIGFAEISGHAERGYGFRRAFFPFPKPAGIQMGVTE
ncbi:MAG: hypothetical protein BWX80_00559 [Candidatus Hydrogenedentes bacterium ADurb.Bin101]|nr:MAG: hypothetical protein BWX80_00559 [Candidatus Hydrogenedentes bacterium ADurb.Bin101]